MSTNKYQPRWVKTYYKIKGRCSHETSYVRKGIKCFITKEEVKSLWYRDKGWLLKDPSIDRINNDGDYRYDNCRFIERSKNTKKDRGTKPCYSHPVTQYSLDGVKINDYESITDAARKCGLTFSNVSHCVIGVKRKTAGGFIWKYKK